MHAGSVIAEEIAQFNALAARWWDDTGPMRPLHMMNGPRAEWVAERIGRRFAPGTRVLDVGCGAGLLSEALAKAGYDVLGRLMLAGQSSLELGFAVAIATTILGTVYGAIAGIAGGIIDGIMMRVIDTLLAIPWLVLLLIMVNIFPPNLWTITSSTKVPCG